MFYVFQIGLFDCQMAFVNFVSPFLPCKSSFSHLFAVQCADPLNVWLVAGREVDCAETEVWNLIRWDVINGKLCNRDFLFYFTYLIWVLLDLELDYFLLLCLSTSSFVLCSPNMLCLAAVYNHVIVNLLFCTNCVCCMISALLVAIICWIMCLGVIC